MVDARGNIVMQEFILVPATGCTSSRGVRVHCIILHRSACSRGYKRGEKGRKARKSLVEEEMIEASANIGAQENVCVLRVALSVGDEMGGSPPPLL